MYKYIADHYGLTIDEVLSCCKGRCSSMSRKLGNWQNKRFCSDLSTVMMIFGGSPMTYLDKGVPPKKGLLNEMKRLGIKVCKSKMKVCNNSSLLDIEKIKESGEFYKDAPISIEDTIRALEVAENHTIMLEKEKEDLMAKMPVRNQKYKNRLELIKKKCTKLNNLPNLIKSIASDEFLMKKTFLECNPLIVSKAKSFLVDDEKDENLTEWPKLPGEEKVESKIEKARVEFSKNLLYKTVLTDVSQNIKTDGRNCVDIANEVMKKYREKVYSRVEKSLSEEISRIKKEKINLMKKDIEKDIDRNRSERLAVNKRIKHNNLPSDQLLREGLVEENYELKNRFKVLGEMMEDEIEKSCSLSNRVEEEIPSDFEVRTSMLYTTLRMFDKEAKKSIHRDFLLEKASDPIANFLKPRKLNNDKMLSALLEGDCVNERRLRHTLGIKSVQDQDATGKKNQQQDKMSKKKKNNQNKRGSASKKKLDKVLAEHVKDKKLSSKINKVLDFYGKLRVNEDRSLIKNNRKYTMKEGDLLSDKTLHKFLWMFKKYKLLYIEDECQKVTNLLNTKDVMDEVDLEYRRRLNLLSVDIRLA